MKTPTILLGKMIQKASSLRGGGSALPGLVIERIDPKFVRRILEDLPYGVVVISGTNGKTTTTKMVTELLESQGLRVFTNKTGSNFVRGVISAIIKNIKASGKFNYDIAVLELDEAHAVKFSEVAPIDLALLLNVQRDQVDRFSEISHVAACLKKIALAAKKAAIINREDSRLNKIKVKNPVYFGLSNALAKKFLFDDDLAAHNTKKTKEKPALVTLEKLDQKATFSINSKKYATSLKVKGIYNAFNAAGALAAVKTILPTASDKELINKLSKIESAFGRGETFKINGQEVELFLVKNHSAFQLSLASFADTKHDFMIVINDNIADGRDISWLKDVDFSALKSVKVVSGIRAEYMAIQLKNQNIKVDYQNTDLQKALKEFIGSSKKPKRIFATYTAMLEIRKILSGKSLI